MDMREIINLKAIPISYEKNVYHLNKKELNVIKKTKYRTSKKGHFLSETISLLENKTLSPLKKFIIEKAQEYSRNVLEIKDQIYLTQSWSTLNSINASHPIHSHPNTFISLVYYAQCTSGDLQFHLDTTSIRECFNFNYTINKFNIYNSQTWILPVKTGDIVLFPGHIHHNSLPNQSSESRIIVGANFFIKGTLGSKKTVSLITI
jgi:uncharacterized protein (TIGR02466 family)|tara:strand:+ start:52 stop:666 length:615 start_codon:yes stop_codon:yes gene_type:complete